MDELYDFLATLFDYQQIQIKNKEIIIDMGSIGSNMYHCIITHETHSKYVIFYDMNGVNVNKDSYNSNEELKTIITLFQESALKDPVSGDDKFDDLKVDDLITHIKTPPTNSKFKFKILTYGCRNFNPEYLNTDFEFDVSKYCSHFPDTVTSIKYCRGTDELIQKMVIMGTAFHQTINRMITAIEKNKPRRIGIYCSHGKHRSVAFAELLKKYYYPRISIQHMCIKATHNR
jgi:RNase adaptor protein for sRNA GlmZ degradation